MTRRFPRIVLAVPVLAVLCLGDALLLHRRPLPVMPCGTDRLKASEAPAWVSFDQGTRGGLLHSSAAQGRLTLINFLLNHGHATDERDQCGRTPLHWAAGAGELAAAGLLIERGADVNVRCHNGLTPFHSAVLNDRTAILGVLVKHGAGLDACTPAGETPLHLAVRRGSLASAALLVAKGAGVDASDSSGRTPLHYAAAHGSPPLVQFLLAKGADVNACDEKGITPLHLASEGSRSDPIDDRLFPEAVALLIAEGAAINARDAEGRTPLYRACEAGCPRTVESLLAGGADPSIGDSGGRTPLHAVAALRGDEIPLEVATTLVEHGARVDAPDRRSIQPAQLAATSGDVSLVFFLLRCGAREPDCLYRKDAVAGAGVCSRLFAVLVYCMLMLLATLGAYRYVPERFFLARLCLLTGIVASMAVPCLLERLLPPDLFCLYAQAFPAGIAACLLVRRFGQAVRHPFSMSVSSLLFVLAGGVAFPFAAVFFTYSRILPGTMWSSLAAGMIGGACLFLHEQVMLRKASGEAGVSVPSLFAPATNTSSDGPGLIRQNGTSARGFYTGHARHIN